MGSISVHGTPRQWRDPARSWLAEEKEASNAMHHPLHGFTPETGNEPAVTPIPAATSFATTHRAQPPEAGAAGEQGQADHDTRQHARQMPAAALLNAVLAERSGRSSDGESKRSVSTLSRVRGKKKTQ